MRRGLAVVVATLALASPALGGLTPGPASGLEWKWAGERRYYLENEVVTPIVQFFLSELNYDIRVVAWQTRMVLRCTSEHTRTSRFDLECRVDDVSLSAAAMPQDAAMKVQGDPGRSQLGVALEEMDANLTGAVVQLQMKKNGRIINVDLEGVSKSRQRLAVIHETLRQIVTRAIAGFDINLPRRGDGTRGVWAQYSSLLLAMPNQYASMAGSETIHKITAVDGDHVSFETRGKGVLAQASGQANLFDTRVEGFAVFDVADGSMIERDWTALGKATAGSALSDGFARSPPYGQRGWLHRLAPGETAPPIPPSREVSAPGFALSTLQIWTPLPETPPVMRGSVP